MPILQYERIILPADYPLHVEEMILPPHYNMQDRMHWHDCFEISAVTEGSGAYLVGEEIYPVSAGDVVILNNIEPHQLIVYEEALSQTVITFHAGLLYNGMSNVNDLAYIAPFLERDADFENLVSASSRTAPRILQHIREISREYQVKENGWQLMIKAQLMALLTLLSRHFGDKVDNVRLKQQLLKLRPVFHYIEEHYPQTVTLSDCASLVSFTPQYFSTYFRSVTGIRFIDYLVSVRVHHAAELLKGGGTVTEAALRCGFNNMGNFNTLFKKHIGMTPTAFRRQIK